MFHHFFPCCSSLHFSGSLNVANIHLPTYPWNVLLLELLFWLVMGGRFQWLSLGFLLHGLSYPKYQGPSMGVGLTQGLGTLCMWAFSEWTDSWRTTLTALPTSGAKDPLFVGDLCGIFLCLSHQVISFTKNFYVHTGIKNIYIHFQKYIRKYCIINHIN